MVQYRGETVVLRARGRECKKDRNLAKYIRAPEERTLFFTIQQHKQIYSILLI